MNRRYHCNRATPTTPGFTLVELLVCIAIVALLVTISLPGFGHFMQESRRSDAVISLIRLAGEAERDFLAEKRYFAIRPRSSLDGFYELELVPAADGLGYLATATPVAGGPQAADACGTYWLDASGDRGVSPPENSIVKQGICWRE